MLRLKRRSYRQFPYLHVGLLVSLAANAVCLVTLGLLVRTLPGRSANSPSPEAAPPPGLVQAPSTFFQEIPRPREKWRRSAP